MHMRTIGMLACSLLACGGCTLLVPTDSLQCEIFAARPIYPRPEMDFDYKPSEQCDIYGEPQLSVWLGTSHSPDCYGFGSDDDPAPKFTMDTLILGSSFRPVPERLKALQAERVPVERAQALMEGHGFHCDRFAADESRGILDARCTRLVPPSLRNERCWRVERICVEFFYVEGRVIETWVQVHAQTLWNAFTYELSAPLRSWFDWSIPMKVEGD
jgi:hypothetical protein